MFDLVLEILTEKTEEEEEVICSIYKQKHSSRPSQQGGECVEGGIDAWHLQSCVCKILSPRKMTRPWCSWAAASMYRLLDIQLQVCTVLESRTSTNVSRIWFILCARSDSGSSTLFLEISEGATLPLPNQRISIVSQFDRRDVQASHSVSLLFSSLLLSSEFRQETSHHIPHHLNFLDRQSVPSGRIVSYESCFRVRHCSPSYRQY